MSLDTSSNDQLRRPPFQAKPGATTQCAENVVPLPLEETEWPYSFKPNDPRLAPGVSRVGWIKDMDLDLHKIYSADTDTVLLYCQNKTPGLNLFVDSKKDTVNPVLLEACCWSLIQGMFPEVDLPFETPESLWFSEDVWEEALELLLDVCGAQKNSPEKTRNNLIAMFSIGYTPWDYNPSIDLIMLCNDYECVKHVYKDIERFLQVQNLMLRYSRLPYAIRFVTQSGLFVDFPRILKSFKMPDTVEELIEASINLKPARWGARDGVTNNFYDETSPTCPTLSMTVKPELPPISIELTSARLYRNQSCLGRVSEMGHDHFNFIDSGLIKRFMTGEIPGFNSWVRENKRRGFGVHVHPLTARKIERFHEIPSEFVAIPRNDCPALRDLKESLTCILSKVAIDFSKLPETTQETLILFKQADKIFWHDLDREKGFHALLLTEDFETANFIYADYQRMADLYDADLKPISDFRLIHPSGFYADFDTWNQDFKMEGNFENFVRQCESAEPRFVFGQDYKARLERVSGLKEEFDPLLW